MNTGCLIFAYNSRDVDYASIAVVAGKLAKKHLGIPVSLVTDQSTIEWMKKSSLFDIAESIFESFIETPRPTDYKNRLLNDGDQSSMVPFINSGRSLAWDLTPYERTLLIDSDFLILSDNLKKYLDCFESLMISSAIDDIRDDRIGFLDKNVSDVGIHLSWATAVIFTKNQESKIFFDLVKTIEQEYEIFSDLYRFDSRMYRNDIAFSVAKHIFDGFEENHENYLPKLLSVYDRDILHDVVNDKIVFLISKDSGGYYACSIKNNDVHVMNKQSIIRNRDKLLELAE
jgi:hypothetical protein